MQIDMTITSFSTSQYSTVPSIKKDQKGYADDSMYHKVHVQIPTPLDSEMEVSKKGVRVNVS